ncbi:hypothetical protein V7x_27400 [Crateriforma conspicua]|uniref:Uncharacterized protein n=1 Tax=Crateriforma conspicua TaxID=2527996 RepID=A0A5C6FVX4_9PLAN|nr:hypothetical protein V7x_27400 [Crateriforma conspicua]
MKRSLRRLSVWQNTSAVRRPANLAVGVKSFAPQCGRPSVWRTLTPTACFRNSGRQRRRIRQNPTADHRQSLDQATRFRTTDSPPLVHGGPVRGGKNSGLCADATTRPVFGHAPQLGCRSRSAGEILRPPQQIQFSTSGSRSPIGTDVPACCRPVRPRSLARPGDPNGSHAPDGNKCRPNDKRAATAYANARWRSATDAC